MLMFNKISESESESTDLIIIFVNTMFEEISLLSSLFPLYVIGVVRALVLCVSHYYSAVVNLG